MKFTIITVVKNGLPDIELTIKSVFAQKYKNFEYIIFVGNSSDVPNEFLKNKFKKKIR